MAGGTGGHVFPGLAVAHELQNRGWHIDWFGTKEKMEAQVIPQQGIPIHFLDIAGVRGKGVLTKLLAPFHLLSAVSKARKILKRLQPDVVLGMGGYASGPGGLAAKTLGIPLIVHEQNAIFGLTNRILAKISQFVLTGFDVSQHPQISKAPTNTHWVGNPVRNAFFNVECKSAENQGPIHILITGGSLGARALNEQLPKIINRLAEHHILKVKHQTGKGKLDDIKDLYSDQLNVEPMEFISEPEKALEWADIVICRAGALTVAEVAATGRPAIFVPLPIAVDDHQRHNANSLVDNNAAFLVLQSDISSAMYDKLLALCDSAELRHEMSLKAKALNKRDAAKQVADFCEQAAQGGQR